MREHSFGQNKLNIVDRLLFFLRTRPLIKYFHDCQKVLELGCGYNAPLLTWLSTRFRSGQLVGIDLSVNHNLGKSRISIIAANVDNALPIDSASMDIVISLALLEHLEQPQQFLNEAYRVLKPGGMLLLTTPTPISKPVLEYMAFKLKLIDGVE